MSDQDDFKRLSLDETIRKTFQIFGKGFLVFTKMSVSIIVLIQVLSTPALLAVRSAYDVDADQMNDPYYATEKMNAVYVLTGIKLVIAISIQFVGNIAMIRAVADLYLKRQPNLQACLKVGVQRLCTALAASILAFIGLSIGFVLFIAPGIYFSVKWFVVTPVIVIEGMGAFASFRRSMDLVSGSWCYVFCTVAIFYFFLYVVTLVWALIIGNHAGNTIFSVIGSFVSMLPSIVFQPVLSIMMTTMYINLRIEKEGMNFDILARNLGDSCGDNAYSALMGDEEDADIAIVVSDDV